MVLGITPSTKFVYSLKHLSKDRCYFYTQNSPTELGLKDTVGDYYSK